MHRSYKRQHKISNKLLYILPGMAGIVMLGLAVLANTPISDMAHAESGYLSVLSDRKLEITVPASTVLDITPKATGQFSESSVPVIVETNNPFGYSLVMTTTSPITSTATTSLTRTTPLSDGTTYPTIGTIGSSYSAADFASSDDTKDKWGYKLSGDNYLPMTTGNIPIAATTVADGTDAYGTHQYDLDFAAKVSSDIPYGTYSITLNFMMTGNIPAASSTTFDLAFEYVGADKYNGYYKMQDMTSTICDYVKTPSTANGAHESTQLIDERDGNIYWVTKLLDGKCWMTQNLDFSINSDTVKYLTSNYTNLTEGGSGIYATNYTSSNGVITWTPPASMYTLVSTTGTRGTSGEINYGSNADAANKWANSDTTPHSVDPGQWYETGTYFASSVCNDVSWSVGCNFLNNTKTTAQDGTTPLSTYFTTTPYSGNGAHGAIGNWYNWSTAVASSDSTSASTGLGTAQANSICPKGWKLPMTDSSDTTASTPTAGTWGNLNGLYNNGSTSSDNVTSGNFTGLFAAPLYLVRGGFIYMHSPLSTLYNAGRRGDYWSSSANSVTYGYYLYFRSGSVNPAGDNYRGVGLSVRCVSV